MEKFDKDLAERQLRWDHEMQRLDFICDRLEYPVDPGIRETVTAFNVNGFKVWNSCEGHVEERFGKMVHKHPYVSVGHDEPRYRYEGQKKIEEMIAQKFNIPISQIDINTDAFDAYWEYINGTQTLETEAYIAVRMQNQDLHKAMDTLLREFYAGRVGSGAYLVTRPILAAGEFSISSQEEFGEISVNEVENHRNMLLKERAEMSAFGRFLKERFFNGQN